MKKVRIFRAWFSQNLGLGEKPHAGVCRVEATGTNSGLGETCKINRKTKRFVLFVFCFCMCQGVF